MRRPAGSAHRKGEAGAAALLRDYLPAIGVVGVVSYGLLRLGYVFFYLQLRTTPEEVGYDYARILAESVVGAVELVALGALAFAAVTILYYLIRVTVRLLRHRRQKPSIRAAIRQFPQLKVGRVAVRSLVAGAAIVMVSLPALAWWQGGLAAEGQTVRNVYFVGIPYLPVLAVQAVPADVAWLDGDKGENFPLAQRKCLMYLGKAGDIAIFYDVRTRESVRLPAGEVAISLRFSFFVPEPCRA